MGLRPLDPLCKERRHDRASGRLERASATVSASAAAIDPWDWLKWQFYRSPEREHGEDYDYGMDL